jgi:hypothetical protein
MYAPTTMCLLNHLFLNETGRSQMSEITGVQHDLDGLTEHVCLALSRDDPRTKATTILGGHFWVWRSAPSPPHPSPLMRRERLRIPLLPQSNSPQGRGDGALASVAAATAA